MPAVSQPKPTLFPQPMAPKCWAYAMATWMKHTPRRTGTPPEAVFQACKAFTHPNGALMASQVDKLFDSQFIRMGWKKLAGSEFEFDEIRDLLQLGYVYAIVDTPSNALERAIGVHMSHARVIYGASDPALYGGAEMDTIDPMKGEFTWKLSEVKAQKVILGFAGELLSENKADGDGDGTPSRLFRRQWLHKFEGRQETRWTPRP